MFRNRVSLCPFMCDKSDRVSAKPKANWVLKFVKSAVAETDVPDTIPEFIAQRRRFVLVSGLAHHSGG